jgi:hypothetical protein
MKRGKYAGLSGIRIVNSYVITPPSGKWNITPHFLILV